MIRVSPSLWSPLVMVIIALGPAPYTTRTFSGEMASRLVVGSSHEVSVDDSSAECHASSLECPPTMSGPFSACKIANVTKQLHPASIVLDTPSPTRHRPIADRASAASSRKRQIVRLLV
jgi:hypothetical protein